MTESMLFWAKLGDNEWPVEYQPVVCHLIDVGQVARQLWNDVFRKHVKQWVTTRLGLPDENTTGAWMAFWAAAHDIGKLSPCFQDRGEQTKKLRERLEPHFNFDTIVKPHDHISTKVLNDELQQSNGWFAFSEIVARHIAVAVGGHHGFFPPASDWTKMHDPLGNPAWAAARREILALLARLFGVTDLPAPNPPQPEDQSAWMYVAGLTSVADWIGSNKSFFREYGNQRRLERPFDAERYYRRAEYRARKALKILGWLGRGNDDRQVSIKDYLPKEAVCRPLQVKVEEIVNGMIEPSLLIVEAPMGEGKTEAAWYAAAWWDQHGGQGTYVALPTMATSNQMFDRVGRFLERNTGKKNLMLQHGKAALNERFEKLKFAAFTFDEADNQRSSAVVAEGWFASNKKHGLLAPYGVGTIDQALLAVLQTKHMFVRLFGLAGKCVILDEVHAYDTYMISLIEQMLRWLAALGCPVVLLSATLPKDKRLKLLQAYTGCAQQESAKDAYPRVTIAAVGGRATVTPIETDPQQPRKQPVAIAWLDEANLVATLQQSLANGGCAVVIRNTVSLAQKTYLQLRDTLKEAGIRVEMFHAQFPFGRRRKIERRVLRRYGTQGEQFRKRRQKVVLVATQVVEQSLDLDFDLMVSDVAPIDMILQRMGRLWRHQGRLRPAGMTGPRLYLIEPPAKDGLPDFRAFDKVYSRFVLLRSLLALRAIDPPTIEVPDHLERLVEQVYGKEPLAIPNSWQADLDAAEQKWKEKQDNQYLNAMGVAIADPDQAPLEQASLQLEEDDPDAARRIQAQTRDPDSPPSIQLIVIHHREGRDYLDAEGHEPFNEAESQDTRRTRRLLDNEVTVSHRGCFAFYARRKTPKAWKENGMLRHHRIMRVDGGGKALDGFNLALHHELGLRLVEI